MNHSIPNFTRLGVVGQVESALETKRGFLNEPSLPVVPFPIPEERTTPVAPATIQEPVKDLPPDPILDQLGALEADTEELTAKRNELLIQYGTLKREILFFVTTERSKRRERLIAQHKDCRERGRKAEDELQALDGKITDLQQEMNRASDKLSIATAELRAKIAERKNLHRFSSDEEIEAADKKVELALKRVDKCEAAKADAMNLYNYAALAEKPPLQKKCAAIGAELTRIELALAGRDKLGVDPELGIIGPVGSPTPRPAA